jgi:hypothetical protein
MKPWNVAVIDYARMVGRLTNADSLLQTLR